MAKLKVLESRFPSFLWSCGVDLDTRWVLRNQGPHSYLLSHYQGLHTKGDMISEYDAGVFRDSHGEEKFREVWHLAAAVMPPSEIKKDEPVHAGSLGDNWTLSGDDATWLVVYEPGMKNRVALQNYFSRLFLTVQREGNSYMAALREKAPQFTDQLFNVIDQGKHIQIAFQLPNEQVPRHLKLNDKAKFENNKINTAPQSFERHFLYTKFTDHLEFWDFGNYPHFRLEFVDYQKDDPSTFWSFEAPGVLDFKGQCIIL
jgi:hypothetical protein